MSYPIGAAVRRENTAAPLGEVVKVHSKKRVRGFVPVRWDGQDGWQHVRVTELVHVAQRYEQMAAERMLAFRGLMPASLHITIGRLSY